jgi:hypothetical protein
MVSSQSVFMAGTPNCLCVCVCVCVCVLYVKMCVDGCIGEGLCVHACKQACICVYICVWVRACGLTSPMYMACSGLAAVRLCALCTCLGPKGGLSHMSPHTQTL